MMMATGNAIDGWEMDSLGVFCIGGCPILNDLRKYGFPEFRYYADIDIATLEHRKRWGYPMEVLVI
jgi:hypothetical protein